MAGQRESMLPVISFFVFWLLSVLYLEGLLHFVVYESFSVKFLYVIGFSMAFAGGMTFVMSFLPKKAGFAAALVVLALLIILYGSQIVYKFIFGTLYSVAQIQQGGAAITSFWKETLATIKERFGYLLLLFLPLAALIVLWIRNKKMWGPSNWFWRGAVALVSVACCLITVLCLKIGGTGYFTDYYFYHSDETTTTQAAERFGLLTALRLELTATKTESSTEETYFDIDSALDENASDAAEELDVSSYNVLNIDFDALNELTDDEQIKAINNYCKGITGTNKNAYTGMLSDYNLIVLCAESFSPGAIDPELTPTLYKLANEGIIFNNYYCTFPNNTTDGEYSLCMGLYPDSSRGKTSNSFYATRESYLPFTLATVFSEQAGIQSYGYHNYKGDFYGRDETHTNMGYTMKFAGDGMTFTTDWPASDLEMMEQSIDDYISSDSQFHAYYMTFSGHYKYDLDINPMALRNWRAVVEKPYSVQSKAYLACNIELDKALEYLMQRLEEAGVADKTAIVLAPDHFPYGLSDSQYAELVDYDVDAFTKYQSTLIFWVGGLEENIVVDTYCSSVDVLPTILNLWGFAYDSRMLAGTDVFSDGTHVAVLSDMSFFTDKVWFNASTGEARYQVEKNELPENYVENLIKLVKTKFTLSSNILNSAYYNFVYEKGDVDISRSAWISQFAWNQQFGHKQKEEAKTEEDDLEDKPAEKPEETPDDSEETEVTEPSAGTGTPDSTVGTEATEPSDGTESPDSTAGTEATEPSDGTESPDSTMETEATQTPAETEATKPSEEPEASEATKATESTASSAETETKATEPAPGSGTTETPVEPTTATEASKSGPESGGTEK